MHPTSTGPTLWPNTISVFKYDFFNQDTLLDSFQIIKKSSAYGQIITVSDTDDFSNVLFTKTIDITEKDTVLFDILPHKLIVKKIFMKVDNSTTQTLNLYGRMDYYNI